MRADTYDILNCGPRNRFIANGKLVSNCNWQNLKRGSDIRKAIHAPPGYQLIIADLAQIEARINAWTAGQSNIVSAFHDYDVILGYDAKGKPIRKGPDIYRLAAALIFGKRPEEVTDAERFIGKTAVLGLGYGAGAPKFATMLKTAAGAPKEIVITDAFARDIHSAWRQSNQAIVANWKATGNKFRQAWLSNSTVEDGIVSYERSGDNMFMHMPGGMAIRYDGVELNGNDMDYIKVFRVNKTKEPTVVRGRLYGGLLVENRTQGFARRVVAEHALAIADEVKSWQLVMTTHDELVGLVPNRSANKALKIAKAVMSQAPSCAPGLPIAVDAHVSQRYDK